jgi:hypothetical protein
VEIETQRRQHLVSFSTFFFVGGTPRRHRRGKAFERKLRREQHALNFLWLLGRVHPWLTLLERWAVYFGRQRRRVHGRFETARWSAFGVFRRDSRARRNLILCYHAFTTATLIAADTVVVAVAVMIISIIEQSHEPLVMLK